MTRLAEWTPPALTAGEAATSALDAERAVLGALMVRPERVASLTGTLSAEDFGLAAHGRVWEAIVACGDVGHRPDVLGVTAACRRLGTLEVVGGPVYLANLLDYQHRGVALDTYVRMVREAAIRRMLATVAEETNRAALTETATADTAIAFAQRRLADVAARATAQTEDVLWADAAITGLLPRVEALLAGQSTPGVQTGFRNLDALTGGFGPGQLLTLAARPGQGKTSLALQLAFTVSLTTPVVIFSLEMSREEILLRAVCQQASVDSARFLAGQLPERHHDAVYQAMSALMTRQWAICDRGTLTVPQVRAYTERIAATHGTLGLVVVDYLQLLSTAKGRSQDNRTVQVSEMSRALKNLARDLDVPVLMLSQMSRDIEKRTGGKPQLSDLRESGSIEQDSDKVLFIHRDAMDEDAGRAAVIVAKNRQGPTGTCSLAWIAHATRFDEEV